MVVVGLCFLNFISVTVDIQDYFVLVSGVQHRGQTIICLQTVPPGISSTRLAPSIVVTILLTIFPVLYFTSL